MLGETTPKARWMPRWALLPILAAAGLGLSAGLYFEMRVLETRAANRSFHAYADARAREIETELGGCVATLQSLRSFFESSELVEPEEFAGFAGQLMTQRPSIAMLAWAPRVPGGELAEFVCETQAASTEGFQVTRRGDDGQPTGVDGSAQWLFPIRYAQAAKTGRQQQGFDLGSDPECREAITRAWALGTAVMTSGSRADGQVTLADEVSVVLAVPAAPPGHPGHLESEPDGVVLMVLRLTDVVWSAFGRAYDHVLVAGEYRLFLQDGDLRGSTRFVPAWGTDSKAAAVGAARVDESFEVAERRFRLEAWPSDEFLSNVRTTDPLLVAMIALLLWSGLVAAGLCQTRALSQRVGRERDRLLRSVLTSIEEGVVVADRSGGVKFVNAAARRMLGPIDDSPPQDWPTVCGIHQDEGDGPCPLEQIPLIRAARGHSVRFEHMFVRNAAVPDGVWLSVSGAPLLDEENELQGGIAVLRDVTRLKLAQVEIRRLSSVVEETADAVMVTDARGVIVYVNPAFERMTGFASNEALGRTPRILRSGHNEPGDYGRLWRTLLGGGVYRGRLTNRRSDGSFFECEHTITPIRDDDGKGLYFVAVSRDVTCATERGEG